MTERAPVLTRWTCCPCWPASLAVGGSGRGQAVVLLLLTTLLLFITLFLGGLFALLLLL